MSMYEVTIEETVLHTVVVRASGPHTAKVKAMDIHLNNPHLTREHSKDRYVWNVREIKPTNKEDQQHDAL